MILSVKWRLNSGELFKANSSYKFSSSYTDYGFCCKIFPQLDFENSATKNIDVSQYQSKHAPFMFGFSLFMYLDEDYLSIKPGARNGQRNGLTILLDVDAFEYEFFPKSSKGFIVALSSAGERPMVRQNGGLRNRIILTFKHFKIYFQDSM